ncbi:pyridoxal-phosphate-dependent aminotransferase family protein [Maridesulfovibrio hydrothermalis]|uniref:Aminotransferase class V n=1 Tax=Maridesulfovibrio hydrothermalis AM13 = DSM 14728 TaxID=1121451 RepID=L0RGH9_9BACT|nr:aminotransferase class V-fold PLP-dependent enzyme [Maridesulfovibrio hydrothermalis]CCO25320.1 Aminotransferase class V [Maridesulfovibrio hydrothermalis AM13 = DSM 14728]
MIGDDFAELKLFITGPILLREEVRKAGLLPEFGHRDAENPKRFEPIMKNIMTIAGSPEGYTPVIFNGSGTNVLEASIRSLVADSDKVLNVSVGAFGDLYHKLAVVNGKNAVQLKFTHGRAIDLVKLEAALKKHKPNLVTFTHNETATGVVNDVVAVCELIRAHGAQPIIDAVSIFGGAPAFISESRPLMYCTATQKGLGLPAGFGVAFISEEGIEKAAGVENRGYTTDILAQIAKAKLNQTLTTPNGTLANQMCVQLDYIVNDETVEGRFKRHENMRSIAGKWVETVDGYELFAQEGHRSPTLTTFKTPSYMTIDKLKEVKELMRGYGYLFDPGYGKINNELAEQGESPIFRVGHMADILPEMLEEYLAVLKKVLLKFS